VEMAEVDFKEAMVELARCFEVEEPTSCSLDSRSTELKTMAYQFANFAVHLYVHSANARGGHSPVQNLIPINRPSY
jgi:hypothetical protein